MSQAGPIENGGVSPDVPTLFVCNMGSAVPIDNTIEILAQAVAANSIPVETVGSGNTVEIDLQYSSASASSVANNAGISSFSSVDFTVDANGFVSLTDIASSTDVQVDAFTAPGTNPVIPNGSGIIRVTGGQVASGTTANVIQTNSLAVNEYTIQIQRSQAVASSTIGDNGVSHFDSAYFSVDANGFVTLSNSGAIVTLDGDTGTASGATVTIYANNAAQNCGASVQFVGDDASTLTLNVTDANDNTLIGKTSGNATLSGDSNTSLGSNSSNSLTSGSNNTALGYNALTSMQDGNTNTALGTQAIQTANTGDSNTAIGFESLFSATGPSSNVCLGYASLYALLTGSNNAAIGTNAGINYLGSESNNVLINSNGVVNENNVLRIGTGTGTGVQELNAAYISGINGVNVSSSTARVVTMTAGSDQLGTATITAGSGITVTPTANTITIAASGGSGFSSINMQTLTSTGTYTPSSTSVSYVIVELVGGGGGGGGNSTAGGSGGGGGGYSRSVLPYSSVSGGVSVTIGAGGGGGASGAAGTAGGTTSFGAFLSATGGAGGNSTTTGSRGARGGIGSSGSLNSSGGDSAPTAQNDYSGSVGGSSYFGGGGAGGAGTAGSTENGFDAQNYGGGGGGGGSTNTGGGSSAGGSGAPGVCIITEYIT